MTVISPDLSSQYLGIGSLLVSTRWTDPQSILHFPETHKCLPKCLSPQTAFFLRMFVEWNFSVVCCIWSLFLLKDWGYLFMYSSFLNLTSSTFLSKLSSENSGANVNIIIDVYDIHSPRDYSVSWGQKKQPEIIASPICHIAPNSVWVQLMYHFIWRLGSRQSLCLMEAGQKKRSHCGRHRTKAVGGQPCPSFPFVQHPPWR